MATIEFVKQPKQEIIYKKNTTEISNWNNIYRRARIHMFMVSILILICINQFIGVFVPNPINYLSNLIDSKIKIGLSNIIYCIAGIIAIKLFMTRDFYLPFLGYTVIPSTVMPVHIPDKTNTTIPIKTKPNTKIIYWSALATKKDTQVEKAYGDYINSGVVLSDDNGLANLQIQESTGYIVPRNKHIKRHVHYRLVDETLGMLNPVETIYY